MTIKIRVDSRTLSKAEDKHTVTNIDSVGGVFIVLEENYPIRLLNIGDINYKISTIQAKIVVVLIKKGGGGSNNCTVLWWSIAVEIFSDCIIE